MAKSSKVNAAIFGIFVIAYYVTTVVAKVFTAPVGLLGVAVTFVFVLYHGSRLYGWKNIIVFFLITFVISWFLESLSIAVGFPFGNYYYTGIWKIGEVPWIIMPAYFGAGYLSWLLAHILLTNYDSRIVGKKLIAIPIIASFIMVMWDLSMDPILSTIQGEWIWEDGGFYFGVPLTNFFGWYMTVFLIYLVYSMYLSRNHFKQGANWAKSKSFWIVVPLMYLGVALQYLLAPFFATTNLFIYWSVFLVSIYTMVFVSLISLLRVVEDIK
ncbi:MAG: carotenoid biosynthesis protein [Candidatus Thorarchaeota archaeon]|jgi:putative membrane protein